MDGLKAIAGALAIILVMVTIYRLITNNDPWIPPDDEDDWF